METLAGIQAGAPADSDRFDPAEYFELPGPPGGFVSRRSEPCADCRCPVRVLIEYRPADSPPRVGIYCRDCVDRSRTQTVSWRDRPRVIGRLDPSGDLVIYRAGGEVRR
jgi:hypothetical protein